LRILIVSGAGGGTSTKSVGKYFHLREFGETLKKYNVEYRLVNELDYVVGFPTKQLKKYFTTRNKIKELIQDFKPDLVLIDRQGYFGLEILKMKIPLFVLLRGHYWSEIEYAKNTIYKNKIMHMVIDSRKKVAEKVFAESTEILPICNYLKNIVRKYHPTQKLSVFIEGVDSTKWYKTKGMKLEHPCVGLLQDANWWRKTKEMLTLEKVIQSMPKVHFYWAGDGQYKDEILKVLNKFENFHWLGSLSYPEKVRDYLSELDIYAIITGMDTTPLSLKEAQLMENPVIATNVGGNSEIMVDGKTGYLVEEGNYKDIISKISILVDNKELAIKMGKEGREFIENEFNLNLSVKNFLKIVKPYVN
jgi:glycosyltransferase involved in cell wall biosynthesis